jgi:hypothetical protein
MLFAFCSFAQQDTTGQGEAQMPEIAAPGKPAPEEQTGIMSGNKPFSLTTDPDGEFVYKFNEDNELDALEAKKGVIFTSEDMTLNADKLDYRAAKGELIATGKKVIVRQGDLIITCQLFKYYPDRQHSEFMGNAIVYNKSKDGKVQTTAADKIMVDVVDGKAQMKVQGGGKARPQMSQAAVAPTAAMIPASGGARASILDKPEPSSSQPGLESGQSKPLAPAEQDKDSSGAKLKLMPSMDMGGQATEKTPAVSGTREINPADSRQMEALAGTKKK